MEEIDKYWIKYQVSLKFILYLKEIETRIWELYEHILPCCMILLLSHGHQVFDSKQPHLDVKGPENTVD